MCFPYANRKINMTKSIKSTYIPMVLVPLSLTMLKFVSAWQINVDHLSIILMET